MQAAPLTQDEQERLEALYAYNILDTEAEQVFDDLTLLASQICDTPIALISLVDPDRQWFKSKVGIDAQETSREIAFCSHAIHQRKVFEITDASQDQRFFDNPLVVGDPNIRFYAGAQLVTPNGQAIGTLCAISDKPKKLSEQQKNALQILSREVISQLELRQKIWQLKAADQRKTDFLSNVSHELRTPLNAIISFSHILKEEFKTTAQSPQVTRYLDHLEFSGKRLLGIINSVLDLTKIEEGRMELQPSGIHSHQFFYGLTGLLQARADEKAVRFYHHIDSNIPEVLVADDSKLAQVILNICQNAIKFTPSGKKVELQVIGQDKRLVIVVRDEGIGISHEDQQKLFNKFTQVGKQNQLEGTGLGLVITKGLIELMQGSIKLSSQAHQGTLVKVDLPLISGTQEDLINDNLNTASGFRKNAKVLVVEDNLINQEVAKAIFHQLGLHIEVVDSGEQALDVIAEQSYDLVFMDMHLPGIDGLETTKRILQQRPEIPVVALSADVFTHQVKTTNMLKDYLHKPIERDELVRVLKQLVPIT